MKLIINLLFILLLFSGNHAYASEEKKEHHKENFKKEYIVIFKERESKEKNFIENKEMDGKVLEDYEHLRVQMVELNESVVEGLSKNPNIEAVIENKPWELKSSTITGIDTNINVMDYNWHLNAVNKDVNHYHYGQGVKIAIFDTGINYHNDFKRGANTIIMDRVQCEHTKLTETDKSCVAETKNAFESTHGTEVASVIGSSHNGVAPNAELYSVRITGDFLINRTFPNMLMRGLNWSIENDMDIINISHGFDEEGFYAISDEEILAIDQLLRDVQDTGIQIFASTGNVLAEESLDSVTYPARSPYVVAVGSAEIEENKIDRMTTKSLVSAYGPEVEFVAPGANLTVSTGSTTDRTQASGTSLASPIAAGVFAILKQQFPTAERYSKQFPNDPIITEKELNERLILLMKEQAIPMNGYVGVPEGSRDWEFGSGLVQAIQYGIKGQLNLTNTIKQAYTRPNFDSLVEGIYIGNDTIVYYQEYDGWYKVDDGSGNKYWIDMNETVDVEFELELTADYTHMYEKPSATSENLGTFIKGVKLLTKKAYNFNKNEGEFEWYQVEGGGRLVWVKGSVKTQRNEYFGTLTFEDNTKLYEYPSENAPQIEVKYLSSGRPNYGNAYYAHDFNEEEDRYKWYLMEFRNGKKAWYKKEYEKYKSNLNETSEGIDKIWENYISNPIFQKMKRDKNDEQHIHHYHFFEENFMLTKEQFKNAVKQYTSPYITLMYLDDVNSSSGNFYDTTEILISEEELKISDFQDGKRVMGEYVVIRPSFNSLGFEYGITSSNRPLFVFGEDIISLYPLQNSKDF